MTGQRLQEEEQEYKTPKSRREMRRERELQAGGLTGFLTRHTSAQKPSRKRLPQEEEHEVVGPKSRRELRQERKLLRQKRWQMGWRGGLREILITLLIACALVFGFVRPFVAEAYRIPSESMVPTLGIGDRILANKFIYHIKAPERGDIIVFESVEGGDDETLIKRVVGVAGDEVQVQSGTLYVNDEAQEEPYLNRQGGPSRSSYGPTTVPPDRIFMMGDNRDNSGDSRIFGPVPLENVKGEAFLRFWPVSDLGPLE